MSPNHLGLQTYPCRATVYFRSFFFSIHFWTGPQHGFSGVCTSWHHVAILVADIQQDFQRTCHRKQRRRGVWGPNESIHGKRSGNWCCAGRHLRVIFHARISNMFQYFPLMRPRISTLNLSVFPSFSVNIPMFFFHGCLLHHQNVYRSLWPISCG